MVNFFKGNLDPTAPLVDLWRKLGISGINFFHRLEGHDKVNFFWFSSTMSFHHISIGMPDEFIVGTAAN